MAKLEITNLTHFEIQRLLDELDIQEGTNAFHKKLEYKITCDESGLYYYGQTAVEASLIPA